MRKTCWLLLLTMLLLGCGAARQPVIFLPEYITVQGDEVFHSPRDFAPATAEWLADSGTLVPAATRAALAEYPDSIAAAAGELYPDSPVAFPAGWAQAARAGQPLMAPAGDRFLIEIKLPDSVIRPPGLQLWLQYDLNRARAEYLYFVAR